MKTRLLQFLSLALLASLVTADTSYTVEDDTSESESLADLILKSRIAKFMKKEKIKDIDELFRVCEAIEHSENKKRKHSKLDKLEDMAEKFFDTVGGIMNSAGTDESNREKRSADEAEPRLFATAVDGNNILQVSNLNFMREICISLSIGTDCFNEKFIFLLQTFRMHLQITQNLQFFLTL